MYIKSNIQKHIISYPTSLRYPLIRKIRLSLPSPPPLRRLPIRSTLDKQCQPRNDKNYNRRNRRHNDLPTIIVNVPLPIRTRIVHTHDPTTRHIQRIEVDPQQGIIITEFCLHLPEEMLVRNWRERHTKHLILIADIVRSRVRSLAERNMPREGIIVRATRRVMPIRAVYHAPATIQRFIHGCAANAASIIFFLGYIARLTVLPGPVCASQKVIVD